MQICAISNKFAYDILNQLQENIKFENAKFYVA